MNFNKDRIDMNESLKDLKQKLIALDLLMNNNAKVGDPVKLDDSLIQKYNNTNPFDS